MSDLWLPGWERIEGESSGSWAGDDELAEKGVAHTTEGGSIEGAVRAYRTNRSWPHITADRRTRRVVQHLPLNKPARALKNRPGGAETNREPKVIQIELVGFAAESHLWSEDDLKWLGQVVFGPVSRMAGIPLTTSVVFFGQGAGWILATPTARQRLSAAAWDKYRGWLGHQHVPENDHWDPGALNMSAILKYASLDQEPEMTPEQFKLLQTVNGKLDRVLALAKKTDDTASDNERILRSIFLGRWGEKTGGKEKFVRGDLSWIEDRIRWALEKRFGKA